MSTDPATVEFLLDQLGQRGATFSMRRMFGEYCVYRDGLPVAFVCDDVLFVKDTAAGREAIGALVVPEFGPPYPGAKPYLRLAPDTWDDGAWLRRVLDVTAEALPAPKRKRRVVSDASPIAPPATKASRRSTDERSKPRAPRGKGNPIDTAGPANTPPRKRR
jgi:TfoX/Sxy family transcriptional regulator of competence genes